MAYYIRKGLVEENVEILNTILEAITQHRPAAFPAATPKQMNSMRHFFNRILAAAERLPTEAQGRFTNLRRNTEVALDWDRMRVVVRPKQGMREIPQPVSPDERTALASLATATSPAQLHFKPSPSFDPALFDKQVRALGWELSTAEADDPGDDLLGLLPQSEGEWTQLPPKAEGWLGLIALRIPKPQPTSLLEQFGFTSGRTSDG